MKNIVVIIFLIGIISVAQVPSKHQMDIYNIIDEVSANRIEDDIRTLAGFGTRNTFSDTISFVFENCLKAAMSQGLPINAIESTVSNISNIDLSGADGEYLELAFSIKSCVVLLIFTSFSYGLLLFAPT